MKDRQRRKLQLQHCSLSACVLSSGQEMATVSAVSLMANEFPEGGVVAVHVCVFDGCLGV